MNEDDAKARALAWFELIESNKEMMAIHFASGKSNATDVRIVSRAHRDHTIMNLSRHIKDRNGVSMELAADLADKLLTIPYKLWGDGTSWPNGKLQIIAHSSLSWQDAFTKLVETDPKLKGKFIQVLASFGLDEHWRPI